ncbi:MAG: MBL fold metallo-hydrolase [Acidobacteriota bacterium]
MSQPIGRVTFLGSGTSHGVPMVGCRCPVCLSTDPHDHRSRPSIYIQFVDGTSVLVDTTPDLRTQALRFAVERVDAILFTHCHADHVMGLDDVRRFNVLRNGAPIACYGDADTMKDLRRIFSYAFEATDHGGGLPRIQLQTLTGPLEIGGHQIVPVPIWHGPQMILGYRVGGFAYLTDCSGLPDDSWPLLDRLDTLVIDAVRHRPHRTHFNVAGALAVIERLAPRRAFLTHVCHDLPHEATNQQLPPGVQLAYDGLVLEIASLD